MYFFTADEHYGHTNIIRYCKRPYRNVEEMDEELIQRHNELVGPGDVVVHAGDFTFKKRDRAQEYIAKLSGTHIFLRGGHDYWIPRPAIDIWEKKIDGQYVVVCHYALRVWPRSHHNSWQLFGHSHGMLEPVGKQWDVGVDNNDFCPISFERIKEIMAQRPDNPNLVKTG